MSADVFYPDFFQFDHRDWPKGRLFAVGHVSLTVAFAALGDCVEGSALKLCVRIVQLLSWFKQTHRSYLEVKVLFRSSVGECGFRNAFLRGL